MVSTTDIGNSSPGDLVQARGIAHRAAQLLTKAARANLAPKPDDSQSNLGWDSQARQFLTHPLSGGLVVGLSLSPLKLSIGPQDGEVEVLDLDTVTPGDADLWLDKQLSRAGLNPASNIELPYDLPVEALEISKFAATENAKTLAALSDWFDLAHDAISALSARVPSRFRLSSSLSGRFRFTVKGI